MAFSAALTSSISLHLTVFPHFKINVLFGLTRFVWSFEPSPSNSALRIRLFKSSSTSSYRNRTLFLQSPQPNPTQPEAIAPYHSIYHHEPKFACPQSLSAYDGSSNQGLCLQEVRRPVHQCAISPSTRWWKQNCSLPPFTASYQDFHFHTLRSCEAVYVGSRKVFIRSDLASLPERSSNQDD